MARSIRVAPRSAKPSRKDGTQTGCCLSTGGAAACLGEGQPGGQQLFLYLLWHACPDRLVALAALDLPPCQRVSRCFSGRAIAQTCSNGLLAIDQTKTG